MRYDPEDAASWRLPRVRTLASCTICGTLIVGLNGASLCQDCLEANMAGNVTEVLEAGDLAMPPPYRIGMAPCPFCGELMVGDTISRTYTCFVCRDKAWGTRPIPPPWKLWIWRLRAWWDQWRQR